MFSPNDDGDTEKDMIMCVYLEVCYMLRKTCGMLDKRVTTQHCLYWRPSTPVFFLECSKRIKLQRPNPRGAGTAQPFNARILQERQERQQHQSNHSPELKIQPTGLKNRQDLNALLPVTNQPLTGILEHPLS